MRTVPPRFPASLLSTSFPSSPGFSRRVAPYFTAVLHRPRELRTGPLLHAAARFELVGDHPSANQDLWRTPVA